MNYCLWAVLLCFLFGSAKAENYLLTMSKENEVCQYIENLFSESLIKHGHLALDQMDEFNWVRWDRKFTRTLGNYAPESLLQFKSKYKETYQDYTRVIEYGALFDIDNDGGEEVVLFSHRGKERHAPEYNAYDRLSVLDGASADLFNDTEINFIDLVLYSLARVYRLDEYPSRLIRPFGDERKEFKPPLMADPYIRPLLLNSTYYLALFGNVNTYVGDTRISRGQSLDQKNAVAIIKVNPITDSDKTSFQQRQLQQANSSYTSDICYFVKTQFYK